MMQPNLPASHALKAINLKMAFFVMFATLTASAAIQKIPVKIVHRVTT
jgi:hypothetical protein